MRGRFAPSPTGEMHLGNAWTALLAWLYTRSAGGSMILRIEDLDPDRSRPAYTKLLLEDMKWLGLDWDEGPDVGGSVGPYCQSERRLFYEQALTKLEQAGLIYPCYCTRAELHAVTMAPHRGEGEFVYPGTCRNLTYIEQTKKAGQRHPALRVKVPSQTVMFQDGLLGTYLQQLQQDCGDFVVRRSDGVHAYQLAVVVDDGLMKISHVLRGDDLLASTPRQLYLYRLLQLPTPEFVHVPLLYGPDGHRLSKRHGSLSLWQLRQRGVRPQHIVGYLAWKAGQIGRWEPITPAELVDQFSLQAIPTEPITVEEGFNGL